MPRNTAIPPESFDEILDWLDPDRELAGQKYVQLRHDLARLFMWGRCADLEGLTDEVFDRVARKVHEVKPTYVGDPRLYFRAVANNVIKENFKKTKTYASLDEADLRPRNTAAIAENTEEREECLQSCLQQLTDEKRKLILAYYAKEKQAKIDHRHELAQRLNISLENLRVRVFRIRATLEKCVESCLDRKAQPK
jgi:RNA polymerase sigma factor (sigma-70 family)